MKTLKTTTFTVIDDTMLGSQRERSFVRAVIIVEKDETFVRSAQNVCVCVCGKHRTHHDLRHLIKLALLFACAVHKASPEK